MPELVFPPVSQELPAYFDRYQVLEELGSGAMGIVYLCVDHRLARPVAVKVIRESELMTAAERETFLERFRQEAEAAGRMNHPGIVQIYDIGPSYIVMEFLEGHPLSSVLRAGAPMTVAAVVSIIQRVAEALDYAHKRGIVHRDIKPANIMMLDDGEVKVMDFGVARLDSSKLTVVGTVLGSVRYMAPEQMMGEKVDGRADVFSLAAVAYELLAGTAPFPGKTITEIVSRVVHGSHVPVQQVNDRLPQRLNDVFGKGFATRPQARYATATEFSKDLAAVLAPLGGLAIEHALPVIVIDEAESAQTTIDTPATIVSEGPLASREERALEIKTEPAGADVWLDGTSAGKTPLSSLTLSGADHDVRIESRGPKSGRVTVHLKWRRPS